MRDLGSTIHVLGLLLNALEGEFVQTIEIVAVGQCSRLWCSTSVGDHPTGYGSVGQHLYSWSFTLLGDRSSRITSPIHAFANAGREHAFWSYGLDLFGRIL